MMSATLFRRSVALLASSLLVTTVLPCLWGQMVTGRKMAGFNEAFGLPDSAPSISAEELGIDTGSGTMVNLLGPHEVARVSIRVTNHALKKIHANAILRVVHYGTSVPAGETWVPHVFKLGDSSSVPVTININAQGTQDLVLAPDIPQDFGGYALVLDIPGSGSVFVATLVRAIAPEGGRVLFPAVALDVQEDASMNEGVFDLFQKLGVRGVRLGVGFSPEGSKDREVQQESTRKFMDWATRHDVTVMMTLMNGAAESEDQPLGRPRPWLSPEGVMLKTKDDRAWLPSYDDDFERWTTGLTAKYGWPKSNLNAMELWNEPWDGVSISGWGADIPRYRELYTHMAQGVEAARNREGVRVLIGGTSSSSNARDKLFSDGSARFLKWFDFVSIHYQALAADPSLIPEWTHRGGPYGPVQVWDTESWIANSEDRLAGVIASMYAQGQTRSAPIYRGYVYDSSNLKADGGVYPVVQVWSPAAALAASDRFLGQRKFMRVLYQNGLPWVFAFDGQKDAKTGLPRHDDGTLVVLGDLKKDYLAGATLFRTVAIAPDAQLTLSDLGGKVQLFDFYGNRIASAGGELKIPLNGYGYFLRTDGSSGSFAAMVQAVQSGVTAGVAPVQIVAHDFTQPLGQHPVLRLTLTNVLNRAIEGRLSAQLPGAIFDVSSAPLRLKANETRVVELKTMDVTTVPQNIYPLVARFDAGADGAAELKEDLHVNIISRRTIHVDGDLSDWSGVLPQVLPGSGVSASLTEQAYLPFLKSGASNAAGVDTVYLAYDDQYLYFGAKISDRTPDPGMVRFATRDDDSYFYPERVTTADGKPLLWPSGVRRYSYRKRFDTPAGASSHDNIQLAFNVIAAKPWLASPRGTPPHFITYWDTDYEFALNPVALQYGGGVELWRSFAPGLPIKEYFPREPRAPHDQGPVSGGKLVMRREGDMRFVEAALPWSEIPRVHQRILAGETIKFTCRVNDNGGAARELATDRSVSKMNPFTFHEPWQTHWSNEVEFGAGK